eukprot:scaffold253099_cov21-Tisochrysis_lutea.AAC.1
MGGGPMKPGLRWGDPLPDPRLELGFPLYPEFCTEFCTDPDPGPIYPEFCVEAGPLNPDSRRDPSPWVLYIPLAPTKALSPEEPPSCVPSLPPTNCV